MTETSEVQTLESDVEAARTRLTTTLDRLNDSVSSGSVKKEAFDYAENLKKEALEYGQNFKKEAIDYAQDTKAEIFSYINRTKEEVINGTRDAAQQKVHGITSDLKARVSDHPVGVALIGAGIAWRLYKHPPITTLLVGAGVAVLMSGGKSDRSDHRSYRNPYDDAQPRGYVPDGVGGYGFAREGRGSALIDQASAAASQAQGADLDVAAAAREAANDVVERAGGGADAVRSRASVMAGQAADTASRIRDQAASKVSEMADRASDVAGRTAARVSDTADDAAGRVTSVLSQARGNPLVLTTLGLAGVALLLRSIRKTDAGDRFLNQTGHAVGWGTREVTSSARDMAFRAAYGAGDLAAMAGERLSNTVRRGADAVGIFASSAGATTSSGAGAMGRIAGSAGERATTSASSLNQAGRTARGYGAEAVYYVRHGSPQIGRLLNEEVVHMGQRYPLLLWAVGLTAGAAVGGSLRLSRAEQRILGPLSAAAKQRLQRSANDQYVQVLEVAERFSGDLQETLAGRPGADTQNKHVDTALGGALKTQEDSRSTEMNQKASDRVSGANPRAAQPHSQWTPTSGAGKPPSGPPQTTTTNRPGPKSLNNHISNLDQGSQLGGVKPISDTPGISGNGPGAQNASGSGPRSK